MIFAEKSLQTQGLLVVSKRSSEGKFLTFLQKKSFYTLDRGNNNVENLTDLVSRQKEECIITFIRVSLCRYYLP